ncbi:hypothetical protein [Lysinibacter cavernae]|uniref:hypothetical protein n=1 Tax=Lysinibacter cavernae TaxID=1640652 RepID=UPI003612B4E6
MSVGNVSWTMAKSITQVSSEMGIIDAVARMLDTLMASILQPMASTDPSGSSSIQVSLIGWLVIIAILGTFIATVRKRRGKDLLARLLTVAIIGGILLFSSGQLIANQAKSASDAAAGLPYSPAFGTPGWVMTTVSDVTSIVTTAPTNVVLKMVDSGLGGTIKSDDDLYSCPRITDAMERRFEYLNGTGLLAGSAEGTRITGKDQATKSRIARGTASTQAIDRIWQQSGVRAYVLTQTGSANPYGALAYCQILDRKADGVSAQGNAYITGLAATQGATLADGDYPGVSSEDVDGGRSGAGYSAMFYGNNNENVNASLIAWGACRFDGTNWHLRDGWKGFNTLHNDVGLVDDDCRMWSETYFTQSGEEKFLSGTTNPDKGIPNIFDVDGNGDDVQKKSASAEDSAAVANYIGSIMGTDVGLGSVAASLYQQTSFFGAAPFMLISSATLIAKLIMLLFNVGFWFVLARAVFSAKPMSEDIGPAGKKLVLTSAFAYGLALILSLIAVLSQGIIFFGQLSLGGSSLAMVGWACLTPLLAVIAAHFVFKKIFKMSSPFSIKGMTAWMKGSNNAVPAMSAAAGSFVGSRLANRAGQQAKQTGKRLGSAGLNKLSGGRFGKPVHGMTGGPRPKSLDAMGAATATGTAATAVSVEGITKNRHSMKSAKNLSKSEFQLHRSQTGKAHELDTAGQRADKFRNILTSSRHGLKAAAMSSGQVIKKPMSMARTIAAETDRRQALIASPRGKQIMLQEQKAAFAARQEQSRINGERRAAHLDKMAAKLGLDSSAREGYKGNRTGFMLNAMETTARSTRAGLSAGVTATGRGAASVASSAHKRIQDKGGYAQATMRATKVTAAAAGIGAAALIAPIPTALVAGAVIMKSRNQRHAETAVKMNEVRVDRETRMAESAKAAEREQAAIAKAQAKEAKKAQPKSSGGGGGPTFTEKGLEDQVL